MGGRGVQHCVAHIALAVFHVDNPRLKRCVIGVLTCRRLFYSCFGTPDQAEGMGAFLEKRKPSFQPGKDAVLAA
jgi:enoyl-CoA hydratase/carnithine racemase